MDALAYGAPYYAIFWAAGNESSDNPAAGSQVALSPGGAVVGYNATAHPPGDGVYRGGYETIGFNALGKNVITVGAVNDAVSSRLAVAKSVKGNALCSTPTTTYRHQPGPGRRNRPAARP